MEADVNRESGCGHRAGVDLLCRSGLGDCGLQAYEFTENQQLSHRVMWIGEARICGSTLRKNQTPLSG